MDADLKERLDGIERRLESLRRLVLARSNYEARVHEIVINALYADPAKRAKIEPERLAHRLAEIRVEESAKLEESRS